jgi:hypothetical protein
MSFTLGRGVCVCDHPISCRADNNLQDGELLLFSNVDESQMIVFLRSTQRGPDVVSSRTVYIVLVPRRANSFSSQGNHC